MISNDTYGWILFIFTCSILYLELHSLGCATFFDIFLRIYPIVPMDFPFVESWNAPVCFLLRFLQQTFLLGSKFDSLAVSNPIWATFFFQMMEFSKEKKHNSFVKSCFSHFDAMTSPTLWGELPDQKTTDAEHENSDRTRGWWTLRCWRNWSPWAMAYLASSQIPGETTLSPGKNTVKMSRKQMTAVSVGEFHTIWSRWFGMENTQICWVVDIFFPMGFGVAMGLHPVSVTFQTHDLRLRIDGLRRGGFSWLQLLGSPSPRRSIPGSILKWWAALRHLGSQWGPTC